MATKIAKPFVLGTPPRGTGLEAQAHLSTSGSGSRIYSVMGPESGYSRFYYSTSASAPPSLLREWDEKAETFTIGETRKLIEALSMGSVDGALGHPTGAEEDQCQDLAHTERPARRQDRDSGDDNVTMGRRDVFQAHTTEEDRLARRQDSDDKSDDGKKKKNRPSGVEKRSVDRVTTKAKGKVTGWKGKARAHESDSAGLPRVIKRPGLLIPASESDELEEDGSYQVASEEDMYLVPRLSTAKEEHKRQDDSPGG
ncbi:hypothetical protein BDP27DRAFT_1422162 [Rhodocollybia butyracea]|uniref:Uncharacterized protein n=1 Tax=Rhodocollybia butyracea TaxID=206335 RepID=A0A9P5U6U4_9AGAR|nr:hypothetical protein BDP27DRAFT_1422162 [Rhodocollybia butyracea]